MKNSGEKVLRKFLQFIGKLKSLPCCRNEVVIFQLLTHAELDIVHNLQADINVRFQHRLLLIFSSLHSNLVTE